MHFSTFKALDRSKGDPKKIKLCPSWRLFSCGKTRLVLAIIQRLFALGWFRTFSLGLYFAYSYDKCKS